VLSVLLRHELVKISESYTASFEPDKSGSGSEIRERDHESHSKLRASMITARK
jgi:hypothetical protein